MALRLGIVGSTGAVGETALEILDERDIPIDELRLFTSERSAGTTQTFRETEHTTQVIEDGAFEGLDYCIFSAGGEVSKKYIPQCVAEGCVAIDNTSAFRLDPEVPLVVPEVNPADLENLEPRNIIANPNCSTIQMVMALAPLHAELGLKRVIVSTYQSTSGAGAKAMDELSDQVQALFSQREFSITHFPHQIAFNLIPQIDKFEDNGYTKEEMKIVHETRKILHLPNLPVTATCVRVPVFCCHSESVYIETEDAFELPEIYEILGKAPGIKVVDDPKQQMYPLPVDATGQDEVFVGRIRKDLDNPTGLNLWIVSDNLRKGAALNAIQIVEALSQTLQ